MQPDIKMHALNPFCSILGASSIIYSALKKRQALSPKVYICWLYCTYTMHIYINMHTM